MIIFSGFSLWRISVIKGGNRRSLADIVARAAGCTEVPPLTIRLKESMSSHRSLVESPRFTKERERFAPDARRFDEETQ